MEQASHEKAFELHRDCKKFRSRLEDGEGQYGYQQQRQLTRRRQATQNHAAQDCPGDRQRKAYEDGSQPEGGKDN